MRFYGPMGFARRCCVVCNARDLSLSLSFILSRIRLSTYVSYVLHTEIHICVRIVERYRPSPGRRVKGDLVLSRPPAPPSSPAFLPTPPVAAPSFSVFHSFFLRSGPVWILWLARKSKRRKKRRRERERERNNKRKRRRRPGEKEKEERDLRGVDEVRGGPSFRGTVRNG